ncbi:hypothetical protein [Streptomyces natalensis]|uniref:hypothetical protein n=1 Tax=Streptomyces natalensis TaxID=68242 RepID=UPI000A9EB94A|nr:hypothetical protein [Streptomyces natalensis]
MLIETGVELIEFICPRCAERWTRSYELVHSELPSGEVRDYFTADDVRVMSPYTPEGAPPCLRCSWTTVARLVARRSLGGTSETADVARSSEAGPPSSGHGTPSTSSLANGVPVSASARHARRPGAIPGQRRRSRI